MQSRMHQTAMRARLRRLIMPLVAATALSQLTSCFMFNEFKTDAWAVSDECFTLFAANLCIDFDTGLLEASGVHAQVANQTNCKPIKKIRITGWVDKNNNDTEDEGEQIETTEHEVAEEEGSNSVSLGNISASLNAGSGDAEDVHICVEVERVGSSSVTKIPQKIRKC
jgi:hypothetical protein